MTPHEEFSEALRSLGCVVTGEHPIMDGAKHRIAVDGDRKGEQAGFYVGHLDGHPAGYIKNNKTGVEIKWKSKGYSLDSEEKSRLQAEAAVKLQAREAGQIKVQEQAAQRHATQGVNPGRSKAEEAAKAVGGNVLMPIFAPGEQEANPKGFTDFNDLANKSALGQEGMDRQVRSIIDAAAAKHQACIPGQRLAPVAGETQRMRKTVKLK